MRSLWWNSMVREALLSATLVRRVNTPAQPQMAPASLVRGAYWRDYWPGAVVDQACAWPCSMCSSCALSHRVSSVKPASSVNVRRFR